MTPTGKAVARRAHIARVQLPVRSRAVAPTESEGGQRQRRHRGLASLTLPPGKWASWRHLCSRKGSQNRRALESSPCGRGQVTEMTSCGSTRRANCSNWRKRWCAAFLDSSTAHPWRLDLSGDPRFVDRYRVQKPVYEKLPEIEAPAGEGTPLGRAANCRLDEVLRFAAVLTHAVRKQRVTRRRGFFPSDRARGFSLSRSLIVTRPSS